MPKIVTIAGCPSPTSRATAILNYASKVLAQSAISTEMVNIRTLPSDDLLLGRGYSAPIRQSKALIREADAIIIATSVNKATYNGGLKAFFDLLPTDAFRGKIVLPIALSASPLDFAAVDASLRAVLGALGTEQVLDGVYLLERHVQLYDRQLHLESTTQQRLQRSLQSLLREVAQQPIVSLFGRVPYSVALGMQ